MNRTDKQMRLVKHSNTVMDLCQITKVNHQRPFAGKLKKFKVEQTSIEDFSSLKKHMNFTNDLYFYTKVALKL